MGTFVFSSSGTLGMSTKTYAKAKAQVARIMGAQGDPESLGAGDAIHLAIDKLDQYEWNFLTVEGSDLTFTSNVAALPTPFKKPLSLIYSQRPLPYVHQGHWDNSRTGNSSIVTPQAYTLFNSALSGNVRILPSITDGETVAIKYYRPINKPASDNELLDIPSRYERALILDAQAQLLLESGMDDAKVRFLMQRAEQALFIALGDDRSGGPDADQGFTPAMGWAGANWDNDHAQTWIDATFGG